MIYPVKTEVGEHPWGHVVLGFGDDRLLEAVKKARYTALLVSTLVLLLGLIVLQRFSRELTRPVQDLMKGTDQVSQGNFDYQIQVADEGEIGQLARKFNEMTLKLNYYNKQKNLLNKKLHEYNATLEDRIRERTDQLKKIQEEVLLIFHQIPVGLLVVDLDEKIMWFNRELMNIVEIKENDDNSIANSVYSQLGTFNRIGLTDVLKRLSGSEKKQIMRHHLKFEDIRKNKIVEIATQPLIGEDTQLDGTIFIIKDITREVTLEKKMIQHQRLESVGTIAGGIAHDFNNILAIILPNAQLLKLKLQDRPDWVKYLEIIEKAAEQGGSLTGQILSFARGSSRQNLDILNVNHVVSEFSRMIRRVLDRKIEIEQEVEEQLWNIKADRGQVEQILMNLSLNARDAMPHGGKLIFRSSNISVGQNEKNVVDPNLLPGRYVCLEVEDTGMGIPQKHLDKIFDPFFSNKKDGKGTGLGLSVVYGILRSHHGIIDVKSTVGKGTRIRIYFPASQGESAQKVAEENAIKPGTGTLLVVDDEEMIRETLIGMLESLNYKVIVAGHGRKAIEMYKSCQGEIDAILMDIQMPVMDGVEAAHHILKIDPNTRIIFTSGYADPARFDKLKELGFQYFLKKPYKIGILSDTIRQALTEKIKLD